MRGIGRVLYKLGFLKESASILSLGRQHKKKPFPHPSLKCFRDCQHFGCSTVIATSSQLRNGNRCFTFQVCVTRIDIILINQMIPKQSILILIRIVSFNHLLKWMRCQKATKTRRYTWHCPCKYPAPFTFPIGRN